MVGSEACRNPSPELTTFVSSCKHEEIPVEGEYGYSIRLIGADKLEKFQSTRHLPDEVIVTGSRVVDAALRYSGLTDDDFEEFSLKKGLQVLRLLKEFSSLRKLELTNSMVEVRSLHFLQPKACYCIVNERYISAISISFRFSSNRYVS